MKLRHRVLLLVGTVVLAILAGALFVIERTMQEEILTQADAALKRSVAAFQRAEGKRYRTLLTLAAALERNPSLRVAMHTNDFITIWEYIMNVQEDYQVNLILLTDSEGSTTLRTDRRGEQGEDVSTQAALMAALEGYQYSDYWMLETGLYQVVAVPMLGPQDLVEGSLVVGYRADRELAKAIAADTGGSVAIATADKIIAWDREARVDPSFLNEQLRRIQAESPRRAVEFDLSNEQGTFLGVVAPLGNPEVVGSAYIAIVNDIGPSLATLRRARGLLFLLGVVAFLAALAVSAPVVGRVTNPIELVETVVRTVGDGLCQVDTGWIVRLMNPKAEKLLGLKAEAVLGEHLFEIFQFQVKASEGHDISQEELERLAPGESLREDDGVVACRPGGRRFPASFVIAPMYHEQERAGAVLVFRDITQIKDVQRRLVDLSHQAGMADVATGVLHNVGNAFNSIRVSAGLIEEKLSATRLPKLSQAVDLLRQEPEELAHFLSRDPRGAKLPTYLARLSEHLTEENASIRDELARFSSGLDHVQEIIRVQQRHAKHRGQSVAEPMPAAELLDEALAISRASSLSRPIQLERDYVEGCNVRVHRNKVLQILVNLINNAIQAMEVYDQSSHQLTLRINPADGKVLLEVQDDGMGILAENLARVFQHGFTTKQDGHGFGLHNSALAAVEMGGKLTCRSDGPGHGATFSLELPAC